MIDFAGISRTTDRYNFHSHTQFCDGRADMETMLLAAIDNSFSYWGFSPHSPITVESTCNMAFDKVDEYFAEVERLKSLYGNRINVLVGMEIDYLSPEWGPGVDYFRKLPLDYRIGSVHFVKCGDSFIDVDGSTDSFKVKMTHHFDNDIRYVVNAYYDSMCAMIEAGGLDIVGHLDKIGHNAASFAPGIEDEPWYEARVMQVVDLIIDRGLIAELNTKAWTAASRMFPAPKYLYRLLDAGVTIVVSSDAHFPDRVNAGRDEGLNLINNHLNKVVKNQNIQCQ